MDSRCAVSWTKDFRREGPTVEQGDKQVPKKKNTDKQKAKDYFKGFKGAKPGKAGGLKGRKKSR